MEEVWATIPGSEGNYLVSNQGNVYAVSRLLMRKNGVVYYRSGCTIKPQPNSQGYLRVRLTLNGEKRDVFVHRLVAEAFVENTSNGDCVNHKDFNPKNNAADNLEWVSHLENVRYSLDRGRYKRTSSWREHLKSTLAKRMGTPVIGRNIDTGEEVYFQTLNDVRTAGFQPSCVCNCCKGVRAAHKGFAWRYAEEVMRTW